MKDLKVTPRNNSSGNAKVYDMNYFGRNVGIVIAYGAPEAPKPAAKNEALKKA